MNIEKLRAATPQVPAPLLAVAAAQLSDETPVGQQAPREVGKLFSMWLSRAAMLLGHKTWQNENELFTLSVACAELVQRKFAGLKPAEIALAMDRGVAGDYRTSPADVLYVQLPSVASWLLAYQTTCRHAVTVALQKHDAAAHALLNPPKVRDLPAEVAALLQTAVNGALPPAEELDFACVLYTWLKKIGAFNGVFNRADYERFRAEETELFLADQPAGWGPERRLFNQFVEILCKGAAWPEGHPLAKDIATRCKKRVLREWLLEHAVHETEPEALRSLLSAADRPA